MCFLDERISDIFVNIYRATCKLKCDLENEKKDKDNALIFGAHHSDDLAKINYDTCILEKMTQKIKEELQKSSRSYRELYERGKYECDDTNLAEVERFVQANGRFQSLYEKTRLTLIGMLKEIGKVFSALTFETESKKYKKYSGASAKEEKTFSIPPEKIDGIIEDVRCNLDIISELSLALWGPQIRDNKGCKKRAEFDSGIESYSDDKYGFQVAVECLQAVALGDVDCTADGTSQQSIHLDDLEACNKSAIGSKLRRRLEPVENEDGASLSNKSG